MNYQYVVNRDLFKSHTTNVLDACSTHIALKYGKIWSFLIKDSSLGNKNVLRLSFHRYIKKW